VFGVWGLVSGVWGLVSGVWGLVFGVWCLGFGVWGLGFGVWGPLSGSRSVNILDFNWIYTKDSQTIYAFWRS